MELARDLWHGIRRIRHRPGAPVAIVLSLGFAMAVSTSLFALVNSVWFAPWRVPDGEALRIVQPAVSPEELRFWAEHSRAFSGLGGLRSMTVARFGDRVVRLNVVTPNYFDVLGISMWLGQAGNPADAHGAVVSHDFWRTRLGSKPNIVGHTITFGTVDGSRNIPLTVIGVAAQGFAGPDILRTQIWLTATAWRQFEPQGQSGSPSSATRLQAFGRLARGVSDAQATAELSLLSRRFRLNKGLEPEVVSVRGTARFSQREIPAETRRMWGALFVGIVLITLIACANVSNLLLATGHARRGEIAVRLVMGAGRWRVLQQLLTESFFLCIVAASMGLLVTIWLPDVLLHHLLENASPDLSSSLQFSISIDRRVLAFGLLMSAVACVAFALVPALRCSRNVSLSELAIANPHTSGRTLMPGLVSYQVIVSAMALALAGLMLRSDSVTEARAITRSVSNISVIRLHTLRSLDPRRQATLMAEATEEVASIVGADNVAGIVGQPAGVSQVLRVTPNFFSTMQIAFASGRTFVPGDPGEQVVVINEASARRFGPEVQLIGRVLTADDPRLWDHTLDGRLIVGVVKDPFVASPTAYVPTGQADVPDLLIRGRHDHVVTSAARLGAALQPPIEIETMSGSVWVAPALGPSLLIANLIMVFGGVALLLAGIGLFSLLQFSVQQRTREIGIRLAVGAQSSHVVGSIVRSVWWPLIRGLVLGCACALVAGIRMEKAQLLAGLDPLDGLVYGGVVAIVLITFMMAALRPVLHAIRSQPHQSLRCD